MAKKKQRKYQSGGEVPDGRAIREKAGLLQKWALLRLGARGTSLSASGGKRKNQTDPLPRAGLTRSDRLWDHELPS